MAKTKRTRRRFTEEFKTEAVKPVGWPAERSFAGRRRPTSKFYPSRSFSHESLQPGRKALLLRLLPGPSKVVQEALLVGAIADFNSLI